MPCPLPRQGKRTVNTLLALHLLATCASAVADFSQRRLSRFGPKGTLTPTSRRYHLKVLPQSPPGTRSSSVLPRTFRFGASICGLGLAVRCGRCTALEHQLMPELSRLRRNVTVTWPERSGHHASRQIATYFNDRDDCDSPWPILSSRTNRQTAVLRDKNLPNRAHRTSRRHRRQIRARVGAGATLHEDQGDHRNSYQDIENLGNDRNHDNQESWFTAAAAASHIAIKSAATSEAPPISPPSMSDPANSSAALAALTLPP